MDFGKLHKEYQNNFDKLYKDCQDSFNKLEKNRKEILDRFSKGTLECIDLFSIIDRINNISVNLKLTFSDTKTSYLDCLYILCHLEAMSALLWILGVDFNL